MNLFLSWKKFIIYSRLKKEAGFSSAAGILVALAGLIMITIVNQTAKNPLFFSSKKYNDVQNIQAANDSALTIIKGLILEPGRYKCANNSYNPAYRRQPHALDCPVFYPNTVSGRTDLYQVVTNGIANSAYITSGGGVVAGGGPRGGGGGGMGAMSGGAMGGSAASSSSGIGQIGWTYLPNGRPRNGVNGGYKLWPVKEFIITTPFFGKNPIASELQLIYQSMGTPSILTTKVKMERVFFDTNLRGQFLASTEYNGRTYEKRVQLWLHEGRPVVRAYVSAHFTPDTSQLYYCGVRPPNPDTNVVTDEQRTWCHQPKHPDEFVRWGFLSGHFLTPPFDVMAQDRLHCHQWQPNYKYRALPTDPLVFDYWSCNPQWNEWAEGYKAATVTAQVEDPFIGIKIFGYGAASTNPTDKNFAYRAASSVGDMLIDRPTQVDFSIANLTKRPICHNYAQYIIGAEQSQVWRRSVTTTQFPGLSTATVFVRWDETSAPNSWLWYSTTNAVYNSSLERYGKGLRGAIPTRNGQSLPAINCGEIDISSGHIPDVPSEDDGVAPEISLKRTIDTSTLTQTFLPPPIAAQRECQYVRTDGTFTYYPAGIAADQPPRVETYRNTWNPWWDAYLAGLTYLRNSYGSSPPSDLNCCYLYKQYASEGDFKFTCRSISGLTLDTQNNYIPSVSNSGNYK